MIVRTTLVNLTEHTIRVFAASTRRDDPGDLLLELPPSGTVARVREHRRTVGPVVVAGLPLPVVAVSYEAAIDGLPDPRPGAQYIVSRVAAAASSRTDLLFPADEVRDADGRVTGCRILGRFPSPED